MVATLTQQRDRRSHHHAADDAEQGNQRLGRIGRPAGWGGRRDQLGVGLQDGFGARALLGAQQHGLQEVPVDRRVALERFELDRVFVHRAHLMLQSFEVGGQRVVASLGGARLARQSVDDLGDFGADPPLDVAGLGAGVDHRGVACAVGRRQFGGFALGVGLRLLERGDQRRLQNFRNALGGEAALAHLLGFLQPRIGFGFGRLRGEQLRIELAELLGGDAAAATLVEAVASPVVLHRLVRLGDLFAQFGDPAEQELVDAVHRFDFVAALVVEISLG